MMNTLAYPNYGYREDIHLSMNSLNKLHTGGKSEKQLQKEYLKSQEKNNYRCQIDVLDNVKWIITFNFCQGQ